MKQTFRYVALFKLLDVVFQVLAFVVMLLCVTCSELGIIGLYIMGAAQSLSCILWKLFFMGGAPETKGGKLIRNLFLVLLIVFSCLVTVFPDTFWLLSCLMLLLGPVSGLAYFTATLNELVFYRNARKPYYLL